MPKAKTAGRVSGEGDGFSFTVELRDGAIISLHKEVTRLAQPVYARRYRGNYLAGMAASKGKRTR